MSLRPLKQWSKTIGFRLALWYSTMFIFSSVSLFILAYFFLSSSIQEKDRQIIESKLKEYGDEYQTEGISALINKVTSDQHSGKRNSFFVRVIERSGKTLVSNLPDHWRYLDIHEIETPTLKKEEQWIRVTSRTDESVLEIASARLSDGRFLQVGKSTEGREEILESFRMVFSGVFIPMILIGFAGGQLLASRALHPIRHLITTVRSVIETGKMDLRIPSRHTGDELDELVILCNKMLAKIEVLIKGMREALDNVAHDLRTPMTRLRGIAELALQSNQTSETCEDALADCLEESERVLIMLNTLMDISEAETGTLKLELQPLNISTLLENVVELYRYVAEDKNIILSEKCSQDLCSAADPNRMRQVLANLLDNAIKYTPNGGRVDVEASLKRHQVAILIQDTGIGIFPEEIPKIWDRLYRCDHSRSQRGLGLGLSLVKAIVHAHGGHVEVSSQPGKGSTFTVFLPHGS